MKKILAAILASVMMLSLAACGGSDEPADNNSGSNSNSSSSTDTSGSSDGEPYEIYFISKVLGSQYWSVVEAAVRTACEEVGANVTITGINSESDVEAQVRLLQDAVTAQPDAIIIAPCDTVAMTEPVKEAYASGIPLVVIDTPIDAEAGEAYDVLIRTDNKDAGAQCAAAFIERLEGEEQVVLGLQVASVGNQTVNDRLDGFREYWDANAPEGWTVLWDEMKVNDADITRGVSVAQDLMTAHPEMNAVWGVNNTGTVGFGTALKEADRKDIVCIGLDFSADTEQNIRDGYVQGALVQQQYEMGYQGVYQCIDLIEGKTPETTEINTSLFLVTPENIDTPEAEAAMYPAGRE